MAKRVSTSSVKWQLIQGRLQDEKIYFSMKSKLDKYLRQVVTQSADLPKIDWSYYKTRVATPAVVDSFQKSYESLTIPYPTDQGFFDKIKRTEEASMKKAAEEDAKTLKQIEVLTTTLKDLQQRIPYSEMSVEEFMMACPQFKMDPEKPRLWPQFIDEDYPEPPPESMHNGDGGH